MSGIKDQERIDEVRRRLYERGKQQQISLNHQLSNSKEKVNTQWEKPPHSTLPVAPKVEIPNDSFMISQDMASKKRKKSYRTKIVLLGVIFFVIALIISSLFLLFGQRSISGNNITIAASGPFTVGGGQELQMQVGITNDNTVPIESATLIVEYPNGSQSATEPGKELFTERLTLDTIKEGETINVPMKALVFGEENEEKIVKVSVEYRVTGSNATFYKEADPLRFKISSSPVLIHADALKKISSGQETDLTVTITSNSPTTLPAVLVKAEYPSGFDYTKSDPSPSHAQNVWLIKDLKPESTQTITITGVASGKQKDQDVVNFTLAVPNERDPQSLASVFATAQAQFEIEQPFLNIGIKVDNSTDQEIAVEPGKRSNVVLELTNTLSDTLYDMSVEVQLSGNAFSVYDVGPSSGYFDASKNTITWDVSNTPSLHQANPAETERLAFSIEPSSAVAQTPQVNISVNAKAHRVSESQVSEDLIGTAERTLKVISVPKVVGVTSHGNDIFVNTGPVPPVADQATTYTVSYVINNCSNDISNAVVSASLPAYVSWLDQTKGVGTMTYNPTTRGIQSDAGDISANKETYISFQVSLLPRSLQINTVPTLVSASQLKATDKFTGTTVRASGVPVSAQIPNENGPNEASGKVGASTGN